ncbi:unnamed protein product [Calicophoron daubneyi]|uniref:Cystatin domain-containing protein n=1 Tax=Calicophoron daubneyi TaxID=300641 RepID=A0AAV2TXT9_CALDB
MLLTVRTLLMLLVVIISDASPDGGYSDPRPLSNEEEKKFQELIKTNVPNVTEFQFVHVRTQIVVGTNYCVLIRLPNKSCMDVFIFEPLPQDGQGIRVTKYKVVECSSKN